MYKKPFFFKQDGLLKKLNLDEIIYLEAAKNYTRLYTIKKMYMARVSLDSAMELFPENKFLRVHRSFAAAADHINVITRDSVIFTTINVEVPVSRTYYAALPKQVIILDSAAIDTGGKKVTKGRMKKRFK